MDHLLNYKNNKNQFKQNDSKDAYKKELIKIWQVGGNLGKFKILNNVLQ